MPPCHTADRTALATPQLVQTPPSTMHTGTPCNRATADTDGSSGAVAQPSNPGRHGTTAACHAWHPTIMETTNRHTHLPATLYCLLV